MTDEKPKINLSSDDLYDAVDGLVEMIQAIAGDLSKKAGQAIAAKLINKLTDTVSADDIINDIPSDDSPDEDYET